MLFPTSSICVLDDSSRPSCCPTFRIVSAVDANDVFIVCCTLFSPDDSRWSSPSMRCSSDCCVIDSICATTSCESTRGARSLSHAITPRRRPSPPATQLSTLPSDLPLANCNPGDNNLMGEYRGALPSVGGFRGCPPEPLLGKDKSGWAGGKNDVAHFRSRNSGFLPAKPT